MVELYTWLEDDMQSAVTAYDALFPLTNERGNWYLLYETEVRNLFKKSRRSSFDEILMSNDRELFMKVKFFLLCLQVGYFFSYQAT